VWLCKLEDGQSCLYVEHETGPELILHQIALVAGAVGATAFAANQVVKLINNLCQIMRGKVGPARDGNGRFVSVSVEKRLRTTQKIVRHIEKTAKATEKAIHSVQDLFS
jgi:hypothetical protein